MENEVRGVTQPQSFFLDALLWTTCIFVTKPWKLCPSIQIESHSLMEIQKKGGKEVVHEEMVLFWLQSFFKLQEENIKFQLQWICSEWTKVLDVLGEQCYSKMMSPGCVSVGNNFLFRITSCHCRKLLYWHVYVKCCRRFVVKVVSLCRLVRYSGHWFGPHFYMWEREREVY